MPNSRVSFLEAEIRRHQDLYYNSQPEISDADFDALWDELKRLDPENPALMTVGRDSADGFRKARHVIPMGSQEKAADPEEFLSWAARRGGGPFVAQYKMDGASLELQYERGNFLRAVTRGDGTVGDDISANASRMGGFFGKIPDRGFSGGVRCEVLMAKSVRESRFPDKANCRNAANGIMKRKDGKDADALELVAYDVGVEGGENPFATETSKLAWLSAQGFSVVPSVELPDAEAVVRWRAETGAARDSYRFDIDGIVVKLDRTDPDDSRRARPERQIAFKFSLEEAETVVLEVEWSESGASFTPVAVVEPVRLCGTVVRRASLSNPGILRALDLRIGSRVVIVKRGEIIPKIEAVLDYPRKGSPVPVPARCSCGAELVDESTRLRCPNPACPKKLLHRLGKWIGSAGILEVGDALLERLVASGKVSRIADLYRIESRELAELERMGETSAAKIVRNIRASSTVDIARFVAGLDIEGIGETIAAKVAASGYPTLEAIRRASVEALSAIDGIGPATAKALVEGLAACDEEIRALEDVVRVRGQAGGPLEGKSFCFTGELSTMKRANAEAEVKVRGGTVKTSVTRDLWALVTNDPGSGSAKNLKAIEYGVQILGEKEFLELLEAE